MCVCACGCQCICVLNIVSNIEIHTQTHASQYLHIFIVISAQVKSGFANDIIPKIWHSEVGV